MLYDSWGVHHLVTKNNRALLALKPIALFLPYFGPCPALIVWHNIIIDRDMMKIRFLISPPAPGFSIPIMYHN